MTTTLPEKSIAILAASGFDENHMSSMQRALTQMKIAHKIIAPEQGLINGWQNNTWGHYFTVDTIIGTALGSDYDALVLVGGSRGVDKLRENAHTRRIVNHFLEAEKPILAIAEGVDLLALSPKSAGLEVAVEENTILKEAGIVSVDDNQHYNRAVLTADGSDIDAWVEEAMKLIGAVRPFEQEVAA